MDGYQFNLVASYLNEVDAGGNGNFWIGLNDAATKGSYIWDSSNTEATYLNWDTNQPGFKKFVLCHTIQDPEAVFLVAL